MTELEFCAELNAMWDECIDLGVAISRNEGDDSDESYRDAATHYSRILLAFRSVKKALDQHSGMPY
jgi:hypothetical protein